MIGVTKVGIFFLILSILIYLASLQEYSGLLFLVLGILIGSFVYNIIAVIKNANSLSFKFPSTLAGVEGERLEGTIMVSNNSGASSGFAELQSPWGILLRVGYVSNRQRVTLSPELSMKKRGIYPYNDLIFKTSFPFGLIQYKKQIKQDGEIIVYPAVYPCDPPRASGFVPMLGGKFMGKYRTPVGDKFHGVRPMQNNDPVKFVHWPSSSKGLGMMVKEFDEELSGSITFVLDCSTRKIPHGDVTLDWAARAVGSLAFAALDQGNQLSFVNMGSGSIIKISPFTNPDVILTELARMGGGNNYPFMPNMEKILPHLPQKGSFCFILLKAEKSLPSFLMSSPYFSNRLISIYLPEFEDNADIFKEWEVYRYSANQIRKST